MSKQIVEASTHSDSQAGPVAETTSSLQKHRSPVLQPQPSQDATGGRPLPGKDPAEDVGPSPREDERRETSSYEPFGLEDMLTMAETQGET